MIRQRVSAKGNLVIIGEGGTLVAEVNAVGWGKQAPEIASQIADAMNGGIEAIAVRTVQSIAFAGLQQECDALREVAGWAQAVLTALNVGDIHAGSPLHLKLREVMIAYREKQADRSGT